MARPTPRPTPERRWPERRTLALVSGPLAAQLEGSFDGVTASMSSPAVHMRTFRDQSQYINSKLLRGPSDAKFTSVEFPLNFTTGLHTKHQSHDLGLKETESVVVSFRNK